MCCHDRHADSAHARDFIRRLDVSMVMTAARAEGGTYVVDESYRSAEAFIDKNVAEGGRKY